MLEKGLKSGGGGGGRKSAKGVPRLDGSSGDNVGVALKKRAVDSVELLLAGLSVGRGGDADLDGG